MAVAIHSTVLSIVQMLPENIKDVEQETGITYSNCFEIHNDRIHKIRRINETTCIVAGIAAAVATVALAAFTLIIHPFGVILAAGLLAGSFPLSVIIGIGCGFGGYALLKRVTDLGQLKSALGKIKVQDNRTFTVKDKHGSWKSIIVDALLDHWSLKCAIVNTTRPCRREMLQKANLRQLYVFHNAVTVGEFKHYVEKCNSSSLKLFNFIDRVEKLKDPTEIKEVLQHEKTKQFVKSFPLFAALFAQRLKMAWSPELFDSMKMELLGEEWKIHMPKGENPLVTRRDVWDEFFKETAAIAGQNSDSFVRFMSRINGQVITTDKDAFIQDLAFVKKYAQAKSYKLMEDELHDLLGQFTIKELIDLTIENKEFEFLQTFTAKYVKQLFISGNLNLKEAFSFAQQLQSPKLKEVCLQWAVKHFPSERPYVAIDQAYRVLDCQTFAKYIMEITQAIDGKRRKGLDEANDYILARIREGKNELQPLLKHFQEPVSTK